MNGLIGMVVLALLALVIVLVGLWPTEKKAKRGKPVGYVLTNGKVLVDYGDHRKKRIVSLTEARRICERLDFPPEEKETPRQSGWGIRF